MNVQIVPKETKKTSTKPSDSELSIYEKRMIELKADREFNRQMKEADEKEAAEILAKKEEAKKQRQALARVLDPLNVAEDFIQEYPLYYDERLIWWSWDTISNKWTMTDEVNILNQINDAFSISGITSSGLKASYINALKMTARKKRPETLSKDWVQFKDQIINIQTQETLTPSPKYFLVHPIPWKLGNSEETPVIDKIFEEWAGTQYVKTLHEILAYCLYTDYPLHVIIALVGKGRNGKSRFIELARRFVGKENTASTELELLNNRFESSKLYRKLLVVVTETDNNVISKSQFLKKATGQDPVGFEFKGKTGFDETMYAAWLMATNSLPPTKDDTEGFYRRWLIIDFPNQFPEGKDILEKIPEVEYENLARKSIRILKELLDTGKFSNQGTIPERQAKYEERSDPLGRFIHQFCNQDVNAEMLSAEFTTHFTAWQKANGLRQLNHKQLASQLNNKGIEKMQLTKMDGKRNYLLGLSWKIEMDRVSSSFLYCSPYRGNSEEVYPTLSSPIQNTLLNVNEEDLA